MERSVKKTLPEVNPTEQNLVDYVRKLTEVVREIRTVLNRTTGEYAETAVDYECLESDWVVNATAACTITLPSTYRTARTITIIKAAGYVVTVACQDGETVDGAATDTVDALYRARTYVSNDDNWEPYSVGA
jgi:hypothetical protein